MKKRESALRNLLFLIALLLVAVVIVAFLPFLRHPVSVMPPESPEVAAKRLAPENAYRRLEEAVTRPPQRQLIPAAQRTPSRMDSMLQDPLGGLFRTGLPLTFFLDDDPQGRILEKAHEALRQPYFLWPVNWSDPTCPLSRWEVNWHTPRDKQSPNFQREPFMDAINRFTQIYRSLSARPPGIVQADTSGGIGFPHLIDAIDLALFLQEDGDYLWPTIALLQELVPRTYDDARAASESALSEVSERLAALHARLGNATANVEFLLRRIDASHSQSVIANAERPDDVLARISYSIRMRRLRNWIGEHRDELQRAVTLSYAEFRDWQFNQPAVSARSYDFVIANFLDTVKRIVQVKAESGMWLEGAETIVALERYRLKNGSYPETLDPLVPDFLKFVPRDIYVPEKPLLYAREDDNYHLYSVGENRIDNGGVAKFGKAAIALNEDVVVHWPRNLSSVK